MIDFLFPQIGGVELNAKGVLTSIAMALVLGVVLSAVYLFCNRRRGYTSDFPSAIVLLAPLMASVIFLVNSSVAAAVSLGGALALLRIRSNPRDTMDITSLLFAIVIGIGCGTGYYGISIVITAILCAIMVILSASNFGSPKKNQLLLKITVPESLNFEGAFDDILDKYATDWHLNQIRTSDFGSLYELRYMITLDDKTDRREFMDQIRTRNGNLDVVMTLREFDFVSNK